ncbi:hypothetical protein [Gloeocapsopsis dulcis]|nr:hypothetical protein [Gloeocapsopsis dulcis]WNN87432.1 hypothetical protein P0S91_13945 [Gloeocapsopsis dulcis]
MDSVIFNTSLELLDLLFVRVNGSVSSEVILGDITDKFCPEVRELL